MKLLIITAGIIFGPLIILGIAKIISKMSGTVKKANPFKFLGSVFSKPKKLIMWAMIGAIFYGGYLIACYLWPTPERLAFKELSRNLAEIELKTEKDRLAAFNEKVKNGERLTEAEKKEAMEADKKIEKVRKDYSDGKLISPPPKYSAKPKEEVWIFAWRATDELMNENSHQKPYSEYAATDVTYSEKELSFVCFKGSKKEDKIVLTRNDQKENYMGYLFNKQKKEYTPIWLYPDNENFKGYIFANNGAKILATLKRQNQ